MVNRKKIIKYLSLFEKGVFIPNVDRGGDKEIKIIKKAIRVANAQVRILIFFKMEKEIHYIYFFFTTLFNMIQIRQ